MDQLRQLCVNGASGITDAGLASLPGLNLSNLSFDATRDGAQITDAGLTHLTGMTRMEDLNLMGTSITDSGLQQLAGLTNLRKLTLSETNVTRNDQSGRDEEAGSSRRQSDDRTSHCE